jgi:regulatory protein YycI of two-component signal transduction system YycFG
MLKWLGMYKLFSYILIFLGIFFIAGLNNFIQAENGSIDSIDARLSQAVNTQNIVLDDATRAKIASGCKAAQNSLRNTQTNIDSLVKKRVDIYSSMQKDLQIIKLRMNRQGADASETDLLTGKIQQQLDRFTIQADKYGTVLSDVIAVDCSQKPEYFKAGLVLLRTQKNKLLEEANGLKSMIQKSDKDTFEPLKKRLIIE